MIKDFLAWAIARVFEPPTGVEFLEAGFLLILVGAMSFLYSQHKLFPWDELIADAIFVGIFVITLVATDSIQVQVVAMWLLAKIYRVTKTDYVTYARWALGGMALVVFSVFVI